MYPQNACILWLLIGEDLIILFVVCYKVLLLSSGAKRAFGAFGFQKYFVYTYSKGNNEELNIKGPNNFRIPVILRVWDYDLCPYMEYTFTFPNSINWHVLQFDQSLNPDCAPRMLA